MHAPFNINLYKIVYTIQQLNYKSVHANRLKKSIKNRIDPYESPNLKRTERSFKYCAPQVWNQLPYELRSCSEVNVFKKKLKTHLFKKAFE